MVIEDLINKPWNYRLFEQNKKLYLIVVCGSVALFEINIELNEDEIVQYNKLGENYIDFLAKNIQLKPTEFSKRSLPNDFINSLI